MPSIFTHLLIAEEALEALPVGKWRSLLEGQRNAYFLGALAPDLPYFNIFKNYRGLPIGSVLGPVSHDIESRVLGWLGWSLPAQAGFAQRMHSIETTQTLAAWVRWATPRSPALRALLAGIATHVAVDEALHPKINADSGDERSAAGLRRHRELEVNLDFLLLRQRGVNLSALRFDQLLGCFVTEPGRQGEHLDVTLRQAWVDASVAMDGPNALTRRELDAWSLGFSRAMQLLDHRWSPFQQQRNLFLSARGEERWRTHFARELYFSSHIPRAGRAAQHSLFHSSGDQAVAAAGV